MAYCLGGVGWSVFMFGPGPAWQVDPATANPLPSEIIGSMSDTKFSTDGRYLLARDYLTLKVWDLAMDGRPLKLVSLHEGPPPSKRPRPSTKMPRGTAVWDPCRSLLLRVLRPPLSLQQWPHLTPNTKSGLRPRLCELYENDCIFDKFECTWTAGGKAAVTGSYKNQIKVLDTSRSGRGTGIGEGGCVV